MRSRSASTPKTRSAASCRRSAASSIGRCRRHRGAPASTPVRALLVAALAEYADLAQAAAARAALSGDPHSPWYSTDAWWNGSATYAIELMFADGEARHAIKIRARDAGRLRVAIDGDEIE